MKRTLSQSSSESYTKHERYDPRVFEEDHIFDASGLLGWLGRKRKSAIYDNMLTVTGDLNKPKILDVGCGYGEILREFKNGLKVGIDMNHAALKTGATKDKNALFVIGDIEQLPFKPETFDNVICSEVLEHVDNPGRVAQQIIDVTKTDGFFCITVPNEWITTFGRFLLGKKPYKSPAHKTVFSWSELKSLFKYPVVKKLHIPFSFLPFYISTNLVVLFQKKG
jgi:SAM-dependent methyltransferase